MYKFLRFIFGPKKIGTHDGRFHCDEIMACTMLKNYVKKYEEATIIRSRDPNVWKTCDILVDVGGKYKGQKFLDHHQIEFQNTYPKFDVRMSSAGLVYMHFPEIITNILDEIERRQGSKMSFKPKRNKKMEEQIRHLIYRKFIIYIDANDNGVLKVHNKEYSHVPTTLPERISKLNPMWWDQKPQEMQQFFKGMELAKEELYSEVLQIYLGSMQTFPIVKQAFEKRMKYDESGRIMVMERFLPFQKSLLQLQSQTKCLPILFVIFPENKSNKWIVKAVSGEGAFESRQKLREQWRGIVDKNNLKHISGIESINFVHAAGFIGGANELEDAIKMAKLSLPQLQVQQQSV